MSRQPTREGLKDMAKIVIRKLNAETAKDNCSQNVINKCMIALGKILNVERAVYGEMEDGVNDNNEDELLQWLTQHDV